MPETGVAKMASVAIAPSRPLHPATASLSVHRFVRRFRLETVCDKDGRSMGKAYVPEYDTHPIGECANCKSYPCAMCQTSHPRGDHTDYDAHTEATTSG